MVEFLANNILWILSVIIFPLLIWLFNYYIKRPKVSIEVTFDRSQSSPKGYKVYVPIAGEEGIFDARESKQEFELIWFIILKLQNYSSKDAITPKIYFYNDGPKLVLHEPLNYNEPIFSKTQKDIKGKYTLYETQSGQDRSDASILRNEVFKGLKILLEYKDETGFKHYTTWENRICKHPIFKPLRYNNQDFFKLPHGIYRK